jgi:hypothetical protein
MTAALVYDAMVVAIALERLALLVAGLDVDQGCRPHDDSYGRLPDEGGTPARRARFRPGIPRSALRYLNFGWHFRQALPELGLRRLSAVGRLRG